MSDDVRFARVIDAGPEKVFDTFTQPGWIVESACDLRVGGVWAVTFGPSRSRRAPRRRAERVRAPLAGDRGMTEKE
jgi:uncharacterized protein YndB with AHSA1/START domain